MKVYILIWNFSFGGAQKFVIKLANAYQKLGYPVTILAADVTGPLKELLNPEVRIRKFRIPHTNNPLGLLSFYRSTKKIIESDAMVVVNGSNNFRQLSRLNYFTRRWKLVFRLHNDIIIKRSSFSFLKTLEMRILFNQTRVRVLAMSENQKDEHIDLFKLKRIKHIPNFFPEVDVHSDKNDGGRIRAICLSRLSPEKGVQVLVEALAFVKSDVMIDVFGDGPLREKLTVRIKELRLKNLAFKAPVLDIDRTMAKYDFLVLPSLSETFGNAVVEAFNVGLPVVSSDCDGPLNLIDERINGLIAKRNNASDLALKIDQICLRIKSLEFNESVIKDSVPKNYREKEVLSQHLALFDNE